QARRAPGEVRSDGVCPDGPARRGGVRDQCRAAGVDAQAGGGRARRGAAMSINVAQAQLNDARKTLLARWQQCTQRWRDPAATRFEELFIDIIDRDLQKAIAGMSETQSVIHQA